MTLAGMIKFLIILAVVQTIFEILNIDIKILLKEFFIVGLLINILATAYQIVSPLNAYKLFSELYSSNTATYYISADAQGNTGGFVKGSFTRYFGLFDSPMLLGCFSLFATVFFIYFILFSQDKIFKNLLFLLASLVLGILSTTKTYLIGLPLMCVIMIVLYVFSTKLTYNKLWKLLSIAFIFVMLFLCGPKILDFIVRIKPNVTYYLEFLRNPSSIFSTRLGDGGYIGQLLDVVKDNLFIGVGPASIKGEPIADNAYLVLLHHGGLIAIVLVGILFIKFITISLSTKNMLGLFFILVLLFLSTGQTILVGANVTLFVYFYLINLQEDNKKLIFIFGGKNDS
ncbi:hypothetical protein [Floricoccus tropicus]|nr:hypothetical protein [Floricoccus tropicus]